ncbi:MAG: redoxin domain-containing protein [Fimbriimonadaceae bacterium]
MLAALIATFTIAPKITLVDGQQIPVSGKAATVLVFISHDCPIANDSQPDLQKIYTKYKSKNINFVGIYIDPRLTKSQVLKHKSDFKFTYSQSIDTSHALVKFLNAKVTPEAFVLDKDGKTRYQGRINNMYSDLGVRRKTITSHDLDNAIASVLAGKNLNPSKTTPYGCVIPDLADFDGS